MGFFNRTRTDGATYDGQGDHRKGFIDVIKFNGNEDELVWKFPYDNISTAAQLIVNQSQEAVFVRGGDIADIFGPGTKTLSANNIPILQKLVNLPFGGNTPFTAEVWFVSKTVRRNLKFGTPEPIPLTDPQFGEAVIPVRSNGMYGIQIVDSAAFLKNLVGTLHLFTTKDIIEQFRSDIVSALKECLARFITVNHISVTEIAAHLTEINRFLNDAVNDEFQQYGIKVTNIKVMNVDFDKNDPDVQHILSAKSRRKARDVEGFTYQQQRQFDILETAAGNEGTSGDIMGGGMGLGLGLGIGSVFNSKINSIANNAMPSAAIGGAVPPPPAQTVTYYVSVNGQQYGPYDINQMAQMAAARQIDRNTYVWRQGLPQWIAAAQCPDLAHLFASATPPPPPGGPATPPMPSTPPQQP